MHEFPSDPALTWLGDDDGPLRRDGRAERVDILRYIPLRRLTYRLHDGAGLPARVIAKAKRTGGLDRAAVACLAVNRAATRRPSALRVPRMLRMEPPRHALYLEELPGESLNVALAGLDLTDAMEQLGAAASRTSRSWRSRASPRAAPWTGCTSRGEAVERIEPVRAVGRRPRPRGLRRAGADRARGRRLVFCQGDFLPGQVLYDRSGWSVIDFDDSRYADPLSDVAAMYARDAPGARPVGGGRPSTPGVPIWRRTPRAPVSRSTGAGGGGSSPCSSSPSSPSG